MLLDIIFAGALFGFTLARLSYLNVGGSAASSFASGTTKGEWYTYRAGVYRVGMTIHLGAILPSSLLMVFQFVPKIRHKFLLFHRINGYTIILLTLVSNAGALMIARRAFGGTLATQAGVGVLVIASTVSIALAYYNIKRVQIDQHRAWMLRAAFYLGTIITLRIIMIIAAQITGKIGGYYTVMECEKLQYIYNETSSITTPLTEDYPQCGGPGGVSDKMAAVLANWAAGRVEQIIASLYINFGMALWMALLLHAVGVEVYLALTPRESNRLRQVSYDRQMERGFKNPGNAGLTAGRLGDDDTAQSR